MWTPPSAGLLRESIQFERRTSTPDGKGNTLLGWALLSGPHRVQLRPINGKEEILVGKLSGVQPYEVLIRYCAASAAVTPEDSVVNTRTSQRFDITSIQNPDQREMWLSMLVKFGTAES